MYYLVFYYLLNLELPPVNEMFLQHFRRLWSTNFFSKHTSTCAPQKSNNALLVYLDIIILTNSS